MVNINRKGPRKGAKSAATGFIKSIIELQSLTRSRKTKLCMYMHYSADLDVIFLLKNASYKCRKWCIFPSFSQLFYCYTPFCAIAVVKSDLFSSKELFEEDT